MKTITLIDSLCLGIYSTANLEKQVEALKEERDKERNEKGENASL